MRDEFILRRYVQTELNQPCARKILPQGTLYCSKSFDAPKVLGQVVVSHLGEAVKGELRHDNAQSDFYRSPDVMLHADWRYPVDIWNVDVMLWDLFEAQSLFSGRNHDSRQYMTCAHLAEIIGLLGPPPMELLQRGRRVSEFLDDDGHFIAFVPVIEDSLEARETALRGDDIEAFLKFVRRMLLEDRATAEHLLEDPWLYSKSAVYIYMTLRSIGWA